MKVIITGSEGFIGRALSLALQKRGVEVIGIDRKIGKEVADIAKYMPEDLDALIECLYFFDILNKSIEYRSLIFIWTNTKMYVGE